MNLRLVIFFNYVKVIIVYMGDILLSYKTRTFLYAKYEITALLSLKMS